MSDADYIGQQFGSYKIIELINGGTFGSVFKAKHAYFEDDPIVAIKILHSHFGLPEERSQFITEAQLLRKFKHPHMLPVMDVSFQNDVLYMIIQYAEGGTLRNRISKQAGQPFPIVEAIRIVTQVGEALHYAHQHEQHVVHCDLKPENILFNANGDALLADFGIAVILGTTGTKLIGRGGTPGYMAPEQFDGLVSMKSDQYALGCIAYELVAGRRPYNLDGVELVAPSTYNPQLPAHIETAICTAMAKDRNNRYSNVAAFLAALQKTAFSQPTTQPVISQPLTVPVTLRLSAGNQPNILSQTPPDAIEQLFQEGMRAHAMRAHSNVNAEKAFHIWRQIMMTPGVAEHYKITARNSIPELREQMIPLRLKQARKASLQGRWQDEICLWKDLFALEPSDQDLAPLLKKRPLTLDMRSNNLQGVYQRFQIAEQNAQFARMYTGVQQHIQNKDIHAARIQLQMLWRDAPYYGDPAGVAQTLSLTAGVNYEQAIVAELMRLEKERIERESQQQREREQKEKERLALLKQKQEIANQERNTHFLRLVLGTIVSLGIIIQVLRIGILGLVGETVGGASGGVITGAMIIGVVAGLLSTILATATDEMEILKTGGLISGVIGVLGGTALAVVAHGILEGLACLLVTVIVYWIAVFISFVAFAVSYLIAYIIIFILAKVL